MIFYLSFRNGYLFREPELLEECIRAWLAPKELLECEHLILGPTALKNGVTVAAALYAIHRVGLEDRVEHVRGIDLRGEIAVVASVVPANEMAKGSLTIAPVAMEVVSSCS